MPADHLVIDKRFYRDVQKLPKPLQQRIKQILIELQINPLQGRRLHGELSARSKIRLGDYRLIYRFDAKKSTVRVLKIEHRQGVYR